MRVRSLLGTTAACFVQKMGIHEESALLLLKGVQYMEVHVAFHRLVICYSIIENKDHQ